MRIIDRDSKSVKDSQQEFFALARTQQATDEELRKRYMEEKKANENEQVSAEEVRRLEERLAAAEMVAFLGLEPEELGVDMSSEDGDALAQVALILEESFEEQIKAQQNDPEYMELVRSINKSQGIEELEDKDYTGDDPLLIKEFQQKEEEIKRQLEARANRKTAAARGTDGIEEADIIDVEASFVSSDKYSGNKAFSGGGNSSKNSNGIFGSSSNKNSAAGMSKPANNANQEEAAERERNYNADLFALSSTQMMNLAMNGERKAKKKKEKSRFGGKEKFSFKSLWNKTKAWCSSKEAAVMGKICAALCLQTGMAMMTKRIEFDGKLQMLSFIGMSMGIFVVAREARAEGFDIRNLGFM